MGRNKLYQKKVTLSFNVEKWRKKIIDDLAKDQNISRGELMAIIIDYYNKQWYLRNQKKRQEKANAASSIST
jgi:hypothetical protein